MPMQAALPADIAFATETRAFLKADERQVRKFDDTGSASELSNIELHAEFMQAADRAFLPAPSAPVAGMDIA